MQPYTYLIRWPQLNISYYGVRYAQDCNPSDLWNPYKTSSTHVAEFIAEHGEPDVVQVRKTFIDVPVAQNWEHSVLKRIKAVSSDRWLNRNDRLAPPINVLGNIAMRRPELRKKASTNNKGSKNPRYGKKQKKLSCPHCNKIVGVNTFARWHGNNCLVINLNAFRPTGIHNPSYGKSIFAVKITCLCCKNIVDVRNYARSHGPKCKSNLTSLVVNTDLDVYNN